MSFLTTEFVVFFVFVFLLYFSAPQRFRYVVLLLASYIFYASANVYYVSILFASTLVNSALGRWIAAYPVPQKTRCLALGISLNVGVLILFKIVNANENTVPSTQPFVNAALPLGLSFYTFQQIAYLVDKYRGKVKVDDSLGLYALFVAFFPHVSAGPIARTGNLLPQLRQLPAFDPDQFTRGCQLILLGAFKKIVIADNLKLLIDPIYNNPQEYKGLSFLIATCFFAFQLYADFSGYTDIAVGIASILGITLDINFRQPYFSFSVREFWQRWHISLSNWIRDYLFFPLTRISLRLTKGYLPRITQLTVSIGVMGLIGLWHGAAWTFLIWGVLHGLYLGLEALFHRPSSRGTGVSQHIWQGWNLLRTFTLVSLTWIFFRANSVNDALYIICQLFNLEAYSSADFLAVFGLGQDIAQPFLLIAVLLTLDVIDYRWGISTALAKCPLVVRWAIYYAAILVIFWLGVSNTPPFIYDRF